MHRYSPELDRIKQILRQNRRGLSITEISRKIGINRNSVAKYLDVLQIAGEVEVKKVCTAKLYFISDRVPLSEMLSLTSDAILVISASGVIDFANCRFLGIEGWQLDEIAGKKLSELSFSLIDEDIMEKVSSPIPGEIFEKEITVKDEGGSQIFRAKCIGTVLPDGGRATTLIFEDVTVKRECQARLRLKEALYRAVVEDQAEFIIRYSPDRTISFVNDAYCRAFGLDRLEVLGTVFAPSIPAKYQKIVTTQLARLTPDNPAISFENPVIMPDGEEAWHYWTNRAIFGDSGDLIGYQSVGRDITEQVKIQKAKCEIVEELTALSDFSSGLVMLSAHEDICSYAAMSIRKIAPSSLMLYFIIHDGFYHLRAVSDGRNWHDRQAVVTLNNAKGMRFPCPVEIVHSISTPTLERFPDGCAVPFCDGIDDELGGIISELLQKQTCLSMGIIAGMNIIGTCLLFPGKNYPLRSLPLIETMVNQAAVMIQNNYMLQSMQLAETRYESLLDHSPSMIGIHVGEKIVYANPRLREFLGVSVDENVVNLPISKFVHPEVLELVRERVAHVYSKGEAAPPMKERLIDINGSVKEVMVFSLPTVYHGKLGCEFNIQPLS